MLLQYKNKHYFAVQSLITEPSVYVGCFFNDVYTVKHQHVPDAHRKMKYGSVLPLTVAYFVSYFS